MKTLLLSKKLTVFSLLISVFFLLTGCQITQTPETVNAVNSTNVRMTNALFVPARIVIAKGQTVTWTNDDLTAHTITSNHGTALNSGRIEPGQSYSHTFNKHAIYYYHSSINNNMRGIVEVQ